ncbi:hypothetical protein QBC46DRAFT_343277 [Diplogelasinospora grovesii]|uniref:Uncharacterized protein n=1 Tax=Diplogelasinospora grovesii TaxID=303347 RepID=A0AAN6S334_9PEZI|nr:hypothetical protein QBC46DRAFT_343277 [Diplogelasinospora grovesii]
MSWLSRAAPKPKTRYIDNIDISVEMVSEELTKPKYLSLITAEDEIYPQVKAAWPQIKDGIFRILQSFNSTLVAAVLTFIVTAASVFLKALALMPAHAAT